MNEQLLANDTLRQPPCKIKRGFLELYRTSQYSTDADRGRLDADGKQSLPPLVCVEPVRVHIVGILPAIGLTRVEITRQPRERK